MEETAFCTREETWQSECTTSSQPASQPKEALALKVQGPKCVMEDRRENEGPP